MYTPTYVVDQNHQGSSQGYQYGKGSQLNSRKSCDSLRFSTISGMHNHPQSLLSNSPSEDDANFPGSSSGSAVRKAVGVDSILHTTEIDSMPCAGICIRHGKLHGLMVWRFVVRFSGTPIERATSRNNAVIGNFILDTGSPNSLISPEILSALAYRGNLQPGSLVTLLIQGVETRCTVGYYGEASRLSMDFLIAGSLTLHFAARLDAPVLYVESELANCSMENIPQTVPRRHTLHRKVKSLIDKVIQ